MVDKVIREICNEIADMLIEKNKAYGNSALLPIRVFSKADEVEQIKVRIDDKISRIKKGHEFDFEDAEKDLIGYLILLRVARRMRDDLRIYQKESGIDCGIPEEQQTRGRSDNVLEEQPANNSQSKVRIHGCAEKLGEFHRTRLGAADREYLPTSQREDKCHCNTNEGRFRYRHLSGKAET